MIERPKVLHRNKRSDTQLNKVICCPFPLHHIFSEVGGSHKGLCACWSSWGATKWGKGSKFSKWLNEPFPELQQQNENLCDKQREKRKNDCFLGALCATGLPIFHRHWEGVLVSFIWFPKVQDMRATEAEMKYETSVPSLSLKTWSG